MGTANSYRQPTDTKLSNLSGQDFGRMDPSSSEVSVNARKEISTQKDGQRMQYQVNS